MNNQFHNYYYYNIYLKKNTTSYNLNLKIENFINYKLNLKI